MSACLFLPVNKCPLLTPAAVPASPAPSGGFNFAPGSSGMSGSPFAASSTPQGNSSAAAARTRARVAARRRGRK